MFPHYIPTVSETHVEEKVKILIVSLKSALFDLTPTGESNAPRVIYREDHVT